jgi:murein hydrolase activator
MIRYLLYIAFAFCLFLPHKVNGQKEAELRGKIQKKEDEIAVANNLLNETRVSKKSSLNELYLLQRRIALRNDLIEHLNDQVAEFDRQIEENNKNIEQLENQLQQLKDSYAQIIYAAFKHKKGMGKLMFILSAENFNQAYKRIKYLNQLASYRREQAQKIRMKTEKLEFKVHRLESLKDEKQAILNLKQSEKHKLRKERVRVREQVGQLKQRENQLREDIANKQKVVAQLEKEVEALIKAESEKTDLWKNLSPRQRAISSSFEENKGTLPWPVADGIITQKFGENTHPVLKNIKLFNNGVDISTSRNSQVRCIWEGEARKVVSIPGANLTVIVRHGNYLSVYSNLVDVDVKPGDYLKKGAIIGQVFNGQTKNEQVLHLEIYRENRKLNPEQWLR